MRIAVAPFEAPSFQSASHSDWMILGEELIPLPRLVPTWDYQSQLRLQSGLIVDRARICAESGLSETSELQVLVTARSTSTKVEMCVLKLVIPPLKQVDLSLDVTLPGQALGGRLIIETMIVARVPIPVRRTGASFAGAILWTSRQDTTLEGEGGLFPTDSEDFKITRTKHRDAPWVLSVDQMDLESLFAATVRLTLNSGLASVAELLSNPSSPASKRLSKSLELDVVRQLSLIAIQSEEAMARAVVPEGESLGDVLRLLVSRIWPTASVGTLARWRRDQPERLELDIQQFVKAY